MRIRYNGLEHTIRMVKGVEWSRRVGFVREVEDAGLVAELLLQPRDQFDIDESEPLLDIAGIGPATAGNLALAGVGSVAQLATLDMDGIRRVAKELRTSRRAVAAWVSAASRMLSEGMEPESDAMAPPGADGEEYESRG